MKNTSLILGIASALVALTGCTAGGDNPGVEYAPDMYVSKGYEPMSQVAGKKFMYITRFGDTVTISKDGKTMREPVKGTIAIDTRYEAGNSVVNNKLEMQYPYTNTPDGKDSAAKSLKNPVPLTADALARGRKAYMTYCLPCHGTEGKGDGLVAAKFPPNNIPSYSSDRIKNLADGGMYHTITYGLNFMGSYAYALTPQQRWEVIHYVNYLKNK